MSEEFHKWCTSFIHVDRIILHKYGHYGRTGYIIAWDDINLDNINKENWT